MSSTESCKAVREATDRRGTGAGTSAASRASVSYGEALANGVLPASDAGEPARCRSDRGADRCGDALSAVGLLEAVRSTAGRRPSLEPQAHAPRVLRAAAELAATDHSAGAAADSSAAHRAAGAEPDVGARFHDRDALRQPSCTAA